MAVTVFYTFMYIALFWRYLALSLGVPLSMLVHPNKRKCHPDPFICIIFCFWDTSSFQIWGPRPCDTLNICPLSFLYNIAINSGHQEAVESCPVWLR